MCVVSMIYDHYWEKWNPPMPQIPPAMPFPGGIVIPIPTLPTAEEIEEFRRLLERAREYDKKHNQPDCELAEKRKKLQDLADQLGVKIDFL